MKKLRLSIIALLFTCTLFAISPVKANDPGEPCGGADIDSPCGGSGDSGSGAPGLPIDSYAWVLLGAAGLIGIKVIVGKTKEKQAPMI